MDITKVIQDKLPVFEDKRGVIENVDRNFNGDIIFIRSMAGSHRALHYHLKSGHNCYVTLGEIHYYERPVGSTQKPTLYKLKAGDSFWTGSMIEHEMYFPVDSSFICLSTGCRDQNEYEHDLVRLGFYLSKI